MSNDSMMNVHQLCYALENYNLSLYKTELFSACLYTWAVARLDDRSPWRYLVFTMLTISTAMSAILAKNLSAYPAINLTVSSGCGAGLFLKIVDDFFISKRKEE